MKKTGSFLLALLFLGVSLLAACQSGKTPSGTGTDAVSSISTEAVETEPPEARITILPKNDYDGYRFVITYRDLSNMVRDMSYDAEADNVLDIAKYHRAMSVMDYFNIEIEPYVIPGDWSGTESLISIASGESEYDIVMPHSHIAWTNYIAEGYAMEWTESMKYQYLDAEWWDQNAKKTLSIGGKIYTMLGDSSWMLLGSSVGVLFNKTVFDDIGIPYPYEDVKNLTWTFDKFHEAASKTVKDLNGDQVIDLENDRYGYTTGLYMGPTGFQWSTGLLTCAKDENDIPYIDLYNADNVNLFEDFFSMMDEDGFYIYNNRDSFNTQFHEEFSEGRVAIIDTMISNIEQIRNMENWGIVPYPMYTESVGEYHSTADAGVHSPVIPYNTEDVDRTSMVLEALTILGHNDVIPAFYDVTLKTKYTDDNVDKEMLDLIKSTRTFDFAYYTGATEAFTLVGTKLFLTNMSFTTFYQANATSAEAHLDDFLEYLFGSY